jgi:hypothetical protein
VNPDVNKYALGHNSYTDYGDIMNARKMSNMHIIIANDIAGWNTRSNKYTREAEFRLFDSFSDEDRNFKKICSACILMRFFC